MSTHIIDHIVGLLIPRTDENAERQYVIVHEGGDNNLINCDTNRRARSWYVQAKGNEWQILQEACKWAGDCCGGMVKIGGRHTEPESFIRRYRKAMENALTMQEAMEAGITITGRVKLRAEKREGWKFNQLAQNEITLESRTEFSSMIHEAAQPFDLRNAVELALWEKATHGFHPRECLDVICFHLQEGLLKVTHPKVIA